MMRCLVQFGATVAIAAGMLLAGTSPLAAQAGPIRPRIQLAQRGGPKQRILRPKAGKGKGKQQRQINQVEAALQRFLNMTPAQRRAALSQLAPARRQRLLRMLNQLDQLPARDRNALRGRYQFFLGLTPARRQAIREEVQALRGLTPVERRERLGSDEVRSQFSQEELDLLYQVAGEQP